MNYLKIVSNYGMSYKDYNYTYSYSFKIEMKIKIKMKISNIKNMMKNNWKIKMNMNM